MMTLPLSAKERHNAIASAIARRRIARGQSSGTRLANGNVAAVQASFPFLRFTDERGDGACAYRAVARLLFSDPERHRDVRSAVANLLQYEQCAPDAPDAIETPDDGVFVRFRDERMRSGPHFLPDVLLSEVRAWAAEEPIAEQLWRAFGSPATTAPPADDIRSALDARRVYVESPPGEGMTWAGQPELILLQQLLGVRVALLCATEARQPSIHSLGGESSDDNCATVDDRPCIHLGYASNRHYFSVVGIVAGADIDELQLLMAANDSPMKRQAQQLMLDDGWEEMKKARKQAVKLLDDDRSSDCGGVSGILVTKEQSSKSCVVVPAYAKTFTRHSVRLCALHVVEASGGGLWIGTTVPLVGSGSNSVVVALSYHAVDVGLAQAGTNHLDQMASADLFANRETLLMCAPAQLASVVESAPRRFRGTGRVHHVHDVAELARIVEQRGIMSASDALELLRPLALAPCRRDYIRIYDSLLTGTDVRCALRTFVDSLSPPSWLVHRAPIARFDIVTHAGGFDQSLLGPTGQAPSLAVLRGAVSRLEEKFQQLQRVVDTANGANLDRRSGDITNYQSH
jgi:hypothetical protein